MVRNGNERKALKALKGISGAGRLGIRRTTSKQHNIAQKRRSGSFWKAFAAKIVSNCSTDSRASKPSNNIPKTAAKMDANVIVFRLASTVLVVAGGDATARRCIIVL
jgi:hypothetical protein